MPDGYACKALNPDTNELVEYMALTKCTDGHLWKDQFCHELGRLLQGYKTTTGTNTCAILPYDQIPQDRKKDITYCHILVNDRPQKAEPRQVRITAGGDRINYPGEVSTKTSDIVTSKLLFNSVLYTPGGRCRGVDLKDFYLNHILPHKDYI